MQTAWFQGWQQFEEFVLRPAGNGGGAGETFSRLWGGSGPVFVVPDALGWVCSFRDGVDVVLPSEWARRGGGVSGETLPP